LKVIFITFSGSGGCSTTAGKKNAEGRWKIKGVKMTPLKPQTK